MRALNTRLAALLLIYTAVLLLLAAARAAGDGSPLAPLSPFATYFYIAVVIVAAVQLPRAGVQLDRLGFGAGPRWRHLALAAIGVALLSLLGWLLDPLWQSLFGEARNLSRFEPAQTDEMELLRFLAMSWTVAAFGEEFAFRILLQKGVATLLGGSTAAVVVAVVFQAGVFGAVHAYQGPVGVVETFISGLVYGGLTALSRHQIWPAALAHGTGNSIGLLRLYFGAA